MKSKDLQLQLIDSLDHVVAHVEEIIIDSEPLSRQLLDTLKADLDQLVQVVRQIEETELDSPEDSMRKMKDSVEELKRKLSVINEPESEPEPESETPEASEPEPMFEPIPEPEPEPEPIPEPEPASEPEPEPIPEPDLSDFIARPDDEPTSYVTSITAMVQAKAGEQDMSQVAVLSTAMPDEKVVKQVEQRSDIFTRLKETGQMPVASDQNALKSLVDRLRGGTTVNEAHRSAGGTLREGIGINEKFLFINELFKGNIKEYNDMLQALEEAQEIEQMNRVLQPLRQKYIWSEESLAFVTLSDLLKKKFGCAPQIMQD